MLSKGELVKTVERLNDIVCELKAANIEQRKVIDAQVAEIKSSHAEVGRLREQGIADSKDIAALLKREDFATNEMRRLRKLYGETEDELVELKENFRGQCDTRRELERQIAVKDDSHKKMAIAIDLAGKREKAQLDRIEHLRETLDLREKALAEKVLEINHLREELQHEQERHVHTQNMLAMVKKHVNDNQKYKHFYELLHGLCRGEGDET